MNTAVRRKALSAAEVLALPALPSAWPDGGMACGLGRTTTFQLIASGEFPVPVIRVGRSLKVRRSDLLNFLGIREENGSASEVQSEASAGNDEATRGPAGSPLSSKSAPTSRD